MLRSPSVITLLSGLIEMDMEVALLFMYEIILWSILDFTVQVVYRVHASLDQMGPFHILLDEMGLDQMGLDKVGRPHCNKPCIHNVKFPYIL